MEFFHKPAIIHIFQFSYSQILIVDKQRLLILGVTASGKGRLAFELAKKLDAEILSIDSMKVYRRMDIGTAKPSKEARSRLNYHLIDVVEPSEPFSVDRFLNLADAAVKMLLTSLEVET